MGCTVSKELGRASMSAEAALREASQTGDEKSAFKPIAAAAAAAAAVVAPTLPVYQPAPVPSNESERLATLNSLGFLDTAPDPRFDEITKLMCKLFKVSMSIVSMIDEYRCWLKAREGMPVSEAPRDLGICSWTLVPPHPELLVVEDCMKDSRFRNCPLVINAPHIRFYCGAPLVSSNGHVLGNLVIMDKKPGKLDAERAMLLANFAEIVVRQIEKTTTATKQSYLVNKNAQSLLRALDCFSEGLMLCNMGTTGWDVVYVNDSWSRLTGIPTETVVNSALWSHCELVGSSQQMLASIQYAVRKKAEFAVLIAVQGKRFAVTFRPAHQGHLSQDATLLGIPSSVPWNPLNSGNQPFYFGTVRPATPADEASRLNSNIQLRSGSLPRNKEDPFQDVVLGPVLGRGSFGRVYRGVWRGTPVAVKILQYSMGENKAAAACTSLEEIAGTKVVHPNICPCYRVSSRIVSGENEVAPMQQGSTEEDKMWRAVSAKSRPPCISGDSLASDMDSAAGGRGQVRPRDGTQLPPEMEMIYSRSLSGAASVVDSVAEGASKTRQTERQPDGLRDGYAGHAALLKASLMNSAVKQHMAANGSQDGAVASTSSAVGLIDGRTDSRTDGVLSLGSRSPVVEETEDDIEGSNFCSVCSDLSRHSQSSSGMQQAQGEEGAPESAAVAGPSNGVTTPFEAAESGVMLEGKRVVQETWMLMELCDMGTLMGACERGQFMRLADDNSGFVPNMLAICRTLQEICAALGYLHKLDILHADLNGNNVLLVSCNRDERGFTAKVSDFGLSRIVSDVVQTATTGTTTHMPPELLADGDLSKGTDVYALGVIMWELYHGKRAYAGMHPMQVLFQVAVKKLPLDFPEKDPEYVALAKRCLLPDRHERPTTQEMLSVLEKLIRMYSA